MTARGCTTIRDAWEYFSELHGKESPRRTLDELRDYIHSKGLRYEELDEAFWDELFESGWHELEMVSQEAKLNQVQRNQLEGIDNLEMPPRRLLMNCLDCGILDKRVGSTTEGKRFILDHAGHQTKYRSER